MTTIIVMLLQSYKRVYGIIFGMAVFCFYYFVNKNSKLKIGNENLKTELEDLNIEAEKIITIQREQMDIATRPALSRDDIHKWMRGTKNPRSK